MLISICLAIPTGIIFKVKTNFEVAKIFWLGSITTAKAEISSSINICSMPLSASFLNLAIVPSVNVPSVLTVIGEPKLGNMKVRTCRLALSTVLLFSIFAKSLVNANENVAEHYGSVFSAEVEHGASLLRTDEKGVVAIVQQ